MKIALIFSFTMAIAAGAFAAPSITTQPSNILGGPGQTIDVIVKGFSTDIFSLKSEITFSSGGPSGFLQSSTEADNGNYTTTITFALNDSLDGQTFFVTMSDETGSTRSATRTITIGLPDFDVGIVNTIPSQTGAVLSFEASFANSTSSNTPFFPPSATRPSPNTYEMRWLKNGVQVGTGNTLRVSNVDAQSMGVYSLNYNIIGESQTKTANSIFALVSDFWWSNRAEYTNASRILQSPDLGFIAVQPNDNWIYIADSKGGTNGFGWVYINSSNPASTWFYDNGLGWCWTQLNSPSTSGNSFWPSFYNQTRDAWLIYQPDSNPRRFYNTKTQQFIEIPN